MRDDHSIDAAVWSMTTTAAQDAMHDPMEGDVSTTLYRACWRYVAERKNLGRFSHQTAVNNFRTLSAFSGFVGDDYPINRLAARHIEKFLMSRPVAPSTLATEHSILASFTRWCVRKDLLRRDPCRDIEPPKRPKVQPRSFTADEVTAALDACNDERERLCVFLMVQEALRAGEVVTLTTSSIDWTQRGLRVQGKGNKERWVPLSDQTIDAIDKYLNVDPIGPHMPLIRSERHAGRPITRDHLSTLIRRVLFRAGVKRRAFDGKSAHSFRHTAIVDCLDRGADPRDVQVFAGHSLASTTIDHYGNKVLAFGRVRAAVDRGWYGNVPDPPSDVHPSETSETAE